MLSIAGFTSCGLFGPSDETLAAGELVKEANKDLTEIKKLYRENEGDADKLGLRAQIGQALQERDAEKVKKLTDNTVYLIADGMDHAKNAIAKIQEAQDMNINSDYRDYLNFKQLALEKQIEAFEQYRQAARALRDNYDPNNEELRKKVAIEFDQRTEKYQELMEKARDYSSNANEIAKDALQRSVAK